MKPIVDFFHCWMIAALLIGAIVCLAGCTTAPVDPTPKQNAIANAVEDTLSIGLVPVLSKNPDYIPIAKGVASAMGSLGGDTLASADIEAFVSRTNLDPEDARTVAALINAAWDTYCRRYAQQVNASVRPDVKLFLASVANGINRALAALPQAR